MPSTAIASIEYRAEQREMLVLFTSGRRYVYRDVPSAEVEAFRSSSSKGRYFNLHIRDRYDYDECDDPDCV